MDLLAVDVGAGTQDILLYKEGTHLENSVKMVMPSPTVIVGKKIEMAMHEDKDVFLTGPTMGGGASTRAVKAHLETGFKVYATPSAALTINDNLDKVRATGVEITEVAPPEAMVIETGDLDLSALKTAFGLFGLDMPKRIALAVQDHGYSPYKSNRIVRFEHMAETMRSGEGRLESFAHLDPPPQFNRMRAAKEVLDEAGFCAMIMDTGPSALLGATMDPRYEEPSLLLNLGNGHTIGAVMMDDRMIGLFEHHTSLMSPEKLSSLLERLCEGTLTNEDVFEDDGHGACVMEGPGTDSIKSVMVTGPNRWRALAPGALDNFGEIYLAAPAGDMMISGCIGLVEAWKRLEKMEMVADV